jgi:sugar phosphate isomerase/epimerase
MAKEILELGFSCLELGHGLRAPMVAGLLDAQQQLGFRVSSVHCFCPLPPEVLADNPDCYEFTSHRPDARARATRLACQTVETAVRFGAGCVVVHAGRVRTLHGTSRLREVAALRGMGGRHYAREKLAAVRRRERISAMYLERATGCLREVADHAGERGIRLGIENRDDYEAVPSERELALLLDRVGAPHVGYWHDFGHAQIKHHLGLLDHEQWLERVGGLTVGSHVHDVKWPFSDHRPPFTGEVPFEKLRNRLPKDVPFVFEIHPRATSEAIVAARHRWNQVFTT